ncbi:MAG: hypothetical protein EPN97_16595 [Alphaproteobacteria bacterium]|nr:MAG: hypothetical protein EPN97_16595 [Alphaproteobacteria bacterium]
MPKDDRPGPAFNAAARQNPELKAIISRVEQDLAPALKMLEDLPGQKGKRFCVQMQSLEDKAYGVSVFFCSSDEGAWRQSRKTFGAALPEACLLVACKEGVFSYHVTGYKQSAMAGLRAVFGGSPKYKVFSTGDFAAARDAFRQEIVQLCPGYRQQVEKAFQSLTAILLFRPLKLKTATVNPVRV